MRKVLLCLLFLQFAITNARSQFLMDMIDTTKDVGKSLFSLYKNYDHLRIGGYIQPQFQLAATKGQAGYEGGDFPPQVNNRFSLRRGRLRFDYARFNHQNQPVLPFVFQFDGSERGVFIRNFWGVILKTPYSFFLFQRACLPGPLGMN